MHARRAALDLRYLGGDGGLARVVELEIKLGDECFRVVGGGGHGRHAGGVFAGAGLKQRGIDGAADIQLDKRIEEGGSVRFKDILPRAAGAIGRRDGE